MIYLNGQWVQVGSHDEAMKVVEENMGSEFACEFGKALCVHIEEAKELAIEEGCENCPYSDL